MRLLPKYYGGFLVSPDTITTTIYQFELKAYHAKRKTDPKVDQSWIGLKRSFLDDPLYIGMCQHFVEGLKWEQTSYYEMLERGFLSIRYNELNNKEGFFTHYDRLFENICNKGYNNSHTLRPVQVHGGIGKELIRHDGNHRLSIAMILKVPRIRVSHSLVHKQHIPHRRTLADFIPHRPSHGSARTGN